MDDKEDARKKDWDKYLTDPVAKKMAGKIGELFYKKPDDSNFSLMFYPEELFFACNTVASSLAGYCFRPHLTKDDALTDRLKIVYLMSGFCGFRIFSKEQTLVHGRFGGQIKKVSDGELKKNIMDSVTQSNNELNPSPPAEQVANFFLARLREAIDDLPAKENDKKLLRRKAKNYLNHMLIWGYLFAQKMTD